MNTVCHLHAAKPHSMYMQFVDDRMTRVEESYVLRPIHGGSFHTIANINNVTRGPSQNLRIQSVNSLTVKSVVIFAIKNPQQQQIWSIASKHNKPIMKNRW